MATRRLGSSEGIGQRRGAPDGEVAELRRDGYEPALTKSRWWLLKRPENLTDNQVTRPAELLQYNLESVRARLLREEFQRFWEYSTPAWADKFPESGCSRALAVGLRR